MNDTIAIELLRNAMALEQTGRQFYLEAARTTKEKKGQDTYTDLAGDEQNHFDLLKRQYDALTQGKKWVKSSEVQPSTVNLMKHLFPPRKEAISKVISGTSNDADALLFGLDIEVRSYDLYRNAAIETTDPVGKELFEFLASQENGHFDILMMRYDFLYGPIAWL